MQRDCVWKTIYNPVGVLEYIQGTSDSFEMSGRAVME